MMEHIRQFDWCASPSEPPHFVREEDLDNCVTERLLRNKYFDPMYMSDSDSEENKIVIDWDQVFKKRSFGDNLNRMHVPGLRNGLHYLKLSSLSRQQHYQCLKVLCAENPHILDMEFIPRPTKSDYKVFEDLQETYLKEQKEYLEWAKVLWMQNHCVRALRPKPTIERMYDAEFKIKANALDSFPKTYELVAQIPMETSNNEFKIVPDKDLILIADTAVPIIKCPEIKVKKFKIMSDCPSPEPCNKHPSRFVLPNEKTPSILPLTEIHKELAQFALDNGAQFIASENALKCLVESNRSWILPLSVCQVVEPDGSKCNNIVLGSEFSTKRESALIRNYRAYRHLLEYSLLPKTKMNKQARQCAASEEENMNMNDTNDSINDNVNMISDDDDDNNLVIDAELHEENDTDLVINEEDLPSKTIHENHEIIEAHSEKVEKPQETELNTEIAKTDSIDSSILENTIGVYSCSCKDTDYENPPPRSYKRWQVKNVTTSEEYGIIVHCPHKTRSKDGEVILEPILEYQIELGGTKQSQEKIKSLALSLLLRSNASLMNVRIDIVTGETVTFENSSLEELKKQHGDVIEDVANTIHTTFNQLQGLLPGNYLLQHDPNHGANALLYVARANETPQKLALEFDSSQLAEADETKSLKAPPPLVPVLLPAHKFRKILPCAFTWNENYVVKEPRKPPVKQRTPPQAIQWPKKKSKKKMKKIE